MPEPKRRGRPPTEPGGRVPVSFTLQRKRFDELCGVAQRRGVSLAELLRRLLTPPARMP